MYTSEKLNRLTYYVFVRGNMKNNSEIYSFKGNVFKIYFWCLFATTLLVATKGYAQTAEKEAGARFDSLKELPVVEEEEKSEKYDSSIQRSNFLSQKPQYEKEIEEAVKNRRSQFFWKLRMDGQSLQTDSNIQSQIAGGAFGLKFNYELVEGLQFKSRGNVNFQTGRTQDVFGDQEPSSGLYPRDFKIHYRPFEDYLDLEAGVISQGKFNEPLFVSSLPFIGFSENFNYEVGAVTLRLGAQQMVPTSYTQSTRVSEREQVPQFGTQTVAAKWMISRNNFLDASVTHFSYKNLPSVVAFNSFIYGNTVTNTDINNAEFIYGFDGFLNQVTFEQKITNSLSAQLQWNTIQNNKAPSDSGEAQSINLWLANDFGRWIVATHYKDYFIESDAVPSFYNSHYLGHNNRIGHSYRIDVESKKWGVIFSASYTKANLLQTANRRIDGLQQDNQQIFYLSVETLYDFI